MATQWYFCRFPHHVKKSDIPNYETSKFRVRSLMRKSTWAEEERSRIITEFTFYAQNSGYEYDNEYTPGR